LLQLDQPYDQEAVIRTIALGADHAGYALKEYIKGLLQGSDYKIEDQGAFSRDSTDYSDYASAVAQSIIEGGADLGILICGTGLGMSMAANRFKGIRAAVCPTVEHASLGRAHNNANVLCLGARFTPEELAKDILEIFLKTPFEGGRHESRVAKLDQ